MFAFVVGPGGPGYEGRCAKDDNPIERSADHSSRFGSAPVRLPGEPANSRKLAWRRVHLAQTSRRRRVGS